MEEHRVHARRNRRNSGSVSGSQTATKPGKWILLVCISFGLLCIIQASLNVYLRLLLETRAHEITEEINKQKRRLQVIDNYASEGWVYFQGSVYLGSITEQSWEQSRQYCQERGADLIIIKSDQEQTFASTFTGHRWIGLTATQSEPRQWRWVDGSQLNTRFWASGEPNNKYNEYCTETKTKNTGKGWNDLKCSEKRPCICQKRPTF
ncbi:CD209 antigen-like protein C isoform X2 [Boleophthalmus pectinirostris]|uniref:CD209 antigen-like protein C isoform X2 n=1 Tax=Boleophthalmus pectinirostris TaxID=150288 RepID=UPI0024310624|nr:CD209 antigen-like protein C isoform X2 [Boleophthalmus pectinirostris]